MFVLSAEFCLSLLIFAVAVHLATCLRSPLRGIPGPRISLVTSWVLKWHELHAGRTTYIHRLHQKYGPVVRVGPNEVVFASAGAVKEIYCSGGSGFDKTECYDLFKVYGRRYVWSEPQPESHTPRC